MPKQTIHTLAMNNAQERLLKGFDLAWQRAGKVPLGHDIIDDRTQKRHDELMSSSPFNMNLALDSREVTQKPRKQAPLPQPKGQTEKNKLAGKVVDPTAMESAQAADSVSIDTGGGPGGITTTPDY